MTTWDEQLETATAAWQGYCRALEAAGTEALAKTLTHDEIDLAEGLRHLTRMAQLTLLGSLGLHHRWAGGPAALWRGPLSARSGRR